MSGRILADPRTRGEGLAVDSLSSTDSHLNEPGMRDAVDSLILAEMTRMQTDGAFDANNLSAMYLDGSAHLLPSARFASELVEAELRLMQQGQRTQPQMNLTAYDQVPEPSSNLVEDLQQAVRRAETALEAQMSRTINTELSSKYGTDQWKMANSHIEGILQAARTKVSHLTAQGASIEASREGVQLPHSQRLVTLGKRYAEVVQNNFATELACVDAEREVKRLRGLAASIGR